MLVLTRKLNETLLIGDDIQLTILEVQNGCVRLGIKAPRNIKILRKEIVEQVTDINKRASIKANDVNLSELAKKFSKEN